MKTWEKHKKFLMSGNWHVHTSYTDGDNTVREYCQIAVKRKIPLLAFTEHVRRALDYDFGTFLDEIELARREFPKLEILSGCEAKLLPGGGMDVSKGVLRKVDYPILAEHSFPDDANLYLSALKKALKIPELNAWGHPGLHLIATGRSISECELKKVFGIMKRNKVLLELNEKYKLPLASWIKLAKKEGVTFVSGTDAHSKKELR
jgi:DNA polymerase (family 10)/putative hydrolase